MNFLPLELSMMIIDYLSICDLLPCSQTCHAMRNLYRPIIFHRLREIPWQITVDFVRDLNHHIHIQHCWVKLGWFPKDIDKYNVTSMTDLYRKFRIRGDFSMEHLFLHLYECPDIISLDLPNYVLVRIGFGGPVLESILRYGKHPRVQMTRGYLPFILGLTDQTESDPSCIIPDKDQTSFILGCDRTISEQEPLLVLGYIRIPIIEYNNDHILYRSLST